VVHGAHAAAADRDAALGLGLLSPDGLKAEDGRSQNCGGLGNGGRPIHCGRL